MGTLPGSPSPDRRHLLVLVESVEHARRDLDRARRSAAHALVQEPLRRSLLRALEDYAAALELLVAPVPYGMHAEIQIYRNLGRLP